MVYSQLYLQNKFKIPTFISLIIVVLVVLIFLSIFQKKAYPSKASPKKIKKLLITNISYSSASIYWLTEEKGISWIIYGTSVKDLKKIILDDRDLPDKKNSYYNHYVTLKDLLPNSEYFFYVVFDNHLIFQNKNMPFKFRTLPSQIKLKNLKPAYGKVIDIDNTPVKEAVVILALDEKTYYSTLTKSSGEWLIPINIDEKNISEKVKIEIISENKKISSIITNLNKMAPLPETIIIGKNYNFQEENQVLSAHSSLAYNKEGKIDIIYPAKNATIPGFFPLIKGIALPNAEVFIILESTKRYSAKIKADNNGFWSYSVINPLALGKNKITAITKNKENKSIVITHDFYISGDSGAAVLGEATPSATIAISPTFTPTPTFYVSPTPTSPVTGISYFNLSILALSFLIIGVGFLAIF